LIIFGKDTGFQQFNSKFEIKKAGL